MISGASLFKGMGGAFLRCVQARAGVFKWGYYADRRKGSSVV